jgi:hypothetical protein
MVNQKKTLTINIRRKDLYLLAALFIFIIGAGVIIAYNPSGTASPSVFGHSANEVSGTIVGGCSVTCNIGEGAGSFQSCAGMWGVGRCVSTTGLCSSACSCTQGSLIDIGHFYAWGNTHETFASSLATGRHLAITQSYLCMTP